MANETEQSRIVPMRLQKFLARAGVASRRGSENLMSAGRVCVNGQVTTELGSKVDPNTDVVTVDGREVRLSDGSVYLMLNKPTGYLTTMKDPHARHTVAELVPCNTYPGLFPVGRLDMDTTGLLLFTTDGDAGQKLLHPSFEKDKTYLALVVGMLTREERARFAKAGSIVLEDGPCAAATLSFVAKGRVASNVFQNYPSVITSAANAYENKQAELSLWNLTIHEGRKHQVKRMFDALGHKVIALHRDSFGPLSLGTLESGKWRMLTEEETAALKASIREG